LVIKEIRAELLMLARIWRGTTPADDADEYVNYLEERR
jgi:hypothetical protein